MDTLYGLEKATIGNHYFFGWAFQAISRYVSTGRASYDWCKALAKANPDKLLAHMAGAADHSDDGMMVACNRYLKRYCGLNK